MLALSLRRGARARWLSPSLAPAATVAHPAALFSSSPRRAQGGSGLNPLLGHGALPRFEEVEVDRHVKPAVEAALLQLKNGFRAAEERLEERLESEGLGGEVMGGGSAAEIYEIAVDDVERAGAPLQFSWGVTSHLMGVKNSDALRDAHEALLPLVVAQSQAVQQSSVVFNALTRARSMPDFPALGEAKRRIVDATLKSMEHAGVGLAVDQREAFNALQQECAALHQTVQNNVLDSTKEFRLDITDKAQLAGLPPTALALASSLWNEAHAEDDGVADGDAENGPWALTLDHPSLLPSLQHLEDRSLREQLYRASREIAAAGGFDNSQNIQRILELRREMAGMLGMDTYAELSLSSKMAPSPADVTHMSEMLKTHARPFAEKELAELQFFAEGECYFQHGRLQHWDVPYYSERLREHRYSYTDEEIRPYFSLPNVLEGLFKLARDLFGVEIVEGGKDDAVQCWHPDTRFFHINDMSSSEHIASFYLDPYSRPHEKRGGAWMDTCMGKSRATGQRIPVAYLVCNGSPPTGDGAPSLMTFREVETLFHEFGHGIQHMLTTVEEGGAAGINNVEWDAVELPSQFMENWCYHDKTLLGFAKHYETGEPLPRALFDKIKAARQFQQGLVMMRQLFFGQVDMALHSIPVGEDIDPLGVQKALANEFLVMPPLENDRQLNSFLHIFGGSSYAAGYYSYKWAEVLSADAFAAFEEAGLDDDEAMRELGARFRDTVLAQGGAKHPMDVFTEFRGRAPEYDALLRHGGLTARATSSSSK